MVTVEPLFFERLPEDMSRDWNTLLESSEPPSFQYDFEYMSAWAKYLRGSWKPFLLRIEENGLTKGIFPLMYLDEKRRGILRYRRIRFLGSTYTDFSVILTSEDKMDAVVGAAMDWISSGKWPWELLILDDLMEENPAARAIKNWLESSSMTCEITEGKYYYINLDRPWEEILSETSKGFVRRNTKRARKMITEAGQWEVVVNPEWNTERIIAEAAPMHIERQADLDRGSFFSDDRSREFLKTVIEHNRSTDRFHSYWLRFEESYITYLFGFVQNDVFYAWNMAFHPDYSKFSPSRLLLFEIIQDTHKKKFKEFSFMRGESEYKSKWTKDFRVNYRFTIKNTASVYGRVVSSLEKLLK